jgi:hypothetical protein
MLNVSSNWTDKERLLVIKAISNVMTIDLMDKEIGMTPEQCFNSATTIWQVSYMPAGWLEKHRAAILEYGTKYA